MLLSECELLNFFVKVVNKLSVPLHRMTAKTRKERNTKGSTKRIVCVFNMKVVTFFVLHPIIDQLL